MSILVGTLRPRSLRAAPDPLAQRFVLRGACPGAGQGVAPVSQRCPQIRGVLEGLVAHKDVPLQREAELAALQGKARSAEGANACGAGWTRETMGGGGLARLAADGRTDQDKRRVSLCVLEVVAIGQPAANAIGPARQCAAAWATSTARWVRGRRSVGSPHDFLARKQFAVEHWHELLHVCFVAKRAHRPCKRTETASSNFCSYLKNARS